MLNFKQRIFHIIALILLFPALGFAQSVIVVAENAAAQDCYQAATAVSTIEDADVSSDMLEPCNVALTQYGLTDDDRAATFANRGVLHAALGSLAEALSDYDEALSLQPSLGQVYSNRGIIYHFEKQFGQALSNYNRALDLDVEDKHLAHFGRGIVYEEMSRWAEAVGDYRKALEYSPDWPPATTRLHWVLNKLETTNNYVVFGQ
ncbi:MAG: hypothetical protein COA71_03020 [SAR86 cluster bacterium]|uniref:Uncharacterized protein n=1 Tax=SAR86 cluster bacterium TaxID=2030880 RepID=A0A2A5CF50_9GAMM|nr:tetratricopeptide repeat protein [Gammaproteobacteria bacterium AH-315-E17]PCJ42499.1 MAG: hypothetical protein COA71_03020 [SAR86 cluster bacterium]